jgi:ribosome maturation factor RimP
MAGVNEWAESPLFFCRKHSQKRRGEKTLAADLAKIREMAQRAAASHGLDVVDLDFHGAGKQRALRVFVEKNAAEREKLAELARSGGADALEDFGGADAVELALKDQLAGVTHKDCEVFSQDFGTLLDVEEAVPGAEYTLEVSSPGLDRKLTSAKEFERFDKSLVKLQTFSAVNGNRHWQGRIVKVSGGNLELDLSAVTQKRQKGAKGAHKTLAAQSVEIEIANVEKAQLVPEI